jgi:hypothetical protein
VLGHAIDHDVQERADGQPKCGATCDEEGEHATYAVALDSPGQ